MDQNFSLMAQSRANYYTAGSPVQFVRVELLKGDETGEEDRESYSTEERSSGERKRAGWVKCR